MLKRIYNSALFSVIKRETNRLSKNWILLFITLIAPIAAYLIIMWMFSDGVIRDIPISVVDLDNTSLSRNIIRQVNVTPATHVQYNSGSLKDAKSLMEKGKIDAVVVIPEGSEKKILSGGSTSIAVYINNSNVVKGGVIKGGLYKTLSTVSAGIKVQTQLKKGYTQGQAISRAVPINLNTHLLFNPYTNYSYFLTLGLLPLMAVVFIFLGSVYVLGIELKESTAKELLKTAEGSATVAITGKLLPYTLLFFINVMVMNLVLFSVLGTPLNGNLTIIILSELLLIIAYQMLAVLFLNITANMRLSLSLGSAYTMMALTFSGLTFPTMAMPLIAKVFSWIFPYTFWLKIFVGQSIRNEPLFEIIPYIIILVAFILSGVLSFKGMKKKLSDSKYWGKE
ncbi:MAG: ABC transporter permease [Bacteroidales bacterium]|nr:ABC transporter permease [Bacteroidales bacterium]